MPRRTAHCIWCWGRNGLSTGYGPAAPSYLGRHNYATPFTTETQHVEVRIDQANTRAIVLAPDGATVTFTHPVISYVDGLYMTFETYYGTSARHRPPREFPAHRGQRDRQDKATRTVVSVIDTTRFGK